MVHVLSTELTVETKNMWVLCIGLLGLFTGAILAFALELCILATAAFQGFQKLPSSTFLL